MTQEERGSNRVHLQDRHELDHLMLCPVDKDNYENTFSEQGFTKINNCQPLQEHISLWPERYVLMYTYRPSAKQINQEVATEAGGEHLGDNIQVGYQGRLQDDGDIGGVEELDGVGVVLAPVAS